MRSRAGRVGAGGGRAAGHRDADLVDGDGGEEPVGVLALGEELEGGAAALNRRADVQLLLVLLDLREKRR